MTALEQACMALGLLAVGYLVWRAVNRKKKPAEPDACARYIEEMRSHTRQRAAKRAATELLR